MKNYLVLFHKSLSILLLIILISILSSCLKNSNVDDIIIPGADLESLNISDNFNWNLTKRISINLNFIETQASNNPLKSIRVDILSPDDETKFFTGATNVLGEINELITVNIFYNELLIRTSFLDTIISIDHESINSTLSAENTSGGFDIESGSVFKSGLATNLLTNPDFDNDDFNWTSSFYTTTDLDKWYMKDTAGHPVYNERVQYNGNWVARIYSISHAQAWCAQIVDNVTVGSTYTLAADGQVLSGIGTDNCSIKLQFCGSNLNANPISNNKLKSWNSEYRHRGISAVAPVGTVHIRVILWVSNTATSDGSVIFDNIRLYEGADSDGDGIIDSEDDYPSDATRAFNNYYPDENVFGTLAFEDIWPGKGDYDFNDLIIDYNINPITNSLNRVVEIEQIFAVRAIGGSFHNGFGIQYNMEPSSISNIDVDQGASLTTEAGQDSAVIIYFSDAYSILSANPSESFVNTDPNGVYVNPDTLINTIELTGTLPSFSSLGTPPYNAFIYIDATRAREVHLPEFYPTDLASGYFGQYQDNTQIGTPSTYYKTSTNLPWAINIPVSFDYPIEKAEITSAYNHFSAWAESEGASYSDWYLDNPGYRNSANIY